MDQAQQIADRLKQANNILVTVSNNPSVDQLAACIGLTLALTKLGKHAIAVFSGDVPSTIEFLQPEKTIEKNTDSLRDFIISLDKAKADKLRYKVEDKVVKIFITPYRTSISQEDLNFSQGDFNVEAVVALGVHNQADLDQAITAHGRILHDATVTTINVAAGGDLGAMNWTDSRASSLSELVVELLDILDKKAVDGQIATALLTGIVAETNRFSNEKTSPTTMSISAELMAAGANQQLVATKLQPAAPEPAPATPDQSPSPETKAEGEGEGEKPAPAEEGKPLAATTKKEEKPEKPKDSTPKAEGMLEIEHTDGQEEEKPEEPPEPPMPQINIDDQGALHNVIEDKSDDKNKKDIAVPPSQSAGPHLILQPPTLGGQLSANSTPDSSESTDPLSLPQPNGPMMQHTSSFQSPASATLAPAPPPEDGLIGQTGLNNLPSINPYSQSTAPLPPQPPLPPINASPAAQLPPPVVSPSAAPLPEPAPASAPPSLPPAPPENTPTPEPPVMVDHARNAVSQAINAVPPARPEPIQALNAQPFDMAASSAGPVPAPAAPAPQATADPNAPPPVPPPMMPPTAAL